MLGRVFPAPSSLPPPPHRNTVGGGNVGLLREAFAWQEPPIHAQCSRASPTMLHGGVLGCGCGIFLRLRARPMGRSELHSVFHCMSGAVITFVHLRDAQNCEDPVLYQPNEQQLTDLHRIHLGCNEARLSTGEREVGRGRREGLRQQLLGKMCLRGMGNVCSAHMPLSALDEGWLRITARWKEGVSKPRESH